MIFDSLGEAPAEEAANKPSSSAGKGVGKVKKVDAKKAMRNRRRRKVLRQTRSLAEDLTYNDSSSDLSCASDSNVGEKRRREEEGENLHGKVSVIGRRREMEDAVAVELGFMSRGEKGYDFFGVYDGHGGWRVAQACSESLHKMLVMILGEGDGGEIDWERLMDQGFKKMDEEVNRDGGAAVATTGSTAVVAVVGEKEVVVANCGDSRAVLSRGGTAIALSDDHKPDRPDELERIEVCGGKVINWNGQRVLGVLATSRSIGDNYMKPFVITEPEVKVINRTDADEFLILASDGLWDVVSNDLACQVVRRCFNGPKRHNSQVPKTPGDPLGDRLLEEALNESHASRAAAVLAELAMARGSGDNISVIVVKLKHATSAESETKASPSTIGDS